MVYAGTLEENIAGARNNRFFKLIWGRSQVGFDEFYYDVIEYEFEGDKENDPNKFEDPDIIDVLLDIEFLLEQDIIEYSLPHKYNLKIEIDEVNRVFNVIEFGDCGYRADIDKIEQILKEFKDKINNIEMQI